MRILVASAMYPPIRTGTSFYSANVAAALARRGHDVCIVTLDAEEEAAQEALPQALRLRSLRLPLPFFKHFRVCSAFAANWAAFEQAARHHAADVILLVNHYLDIALLAARTSRRRGIPLVCSIGTQLQSPHRLAQAVFTLLDRMICGRLLLPHCERIVAWDKEIVRYLTDVHGAQIERRCAIVNYSANGDLGRLLAQPRSYHYRGRLVGVGAVIRQRSFEPLVLAFHALAGEFPELRLDIVGHVYFDRAVRLARRLGLGDRVEFHGELPHERVLAMMRDSDVFFSSLTARYTGLGTATVEAMSMGIPVIVNAFPDILGTARLVDGKHLALIGSTAPEEIVAKLRPLLASEAARTTVGSGGRQFVTRHLTWDKVAADMERVLADAIAGTPSRGSGARPW